MNRRLLLILFLKITLIKAVSWKNPPFTKPENLNENIDGDYWNVVNRDLYVAINEDVEEILIIANLECDQCDKDNLPVLGSFTVGSNTLLGAKIELNNDKIELQITRRQDYLEENQRNYDFQIMINNEPRYVHLKVIDIDNHPPTILVNNRTCKIEENYSGETECTYMIDDKDEITLLSDITFTSNPEQYDDIFEIIYIGSEKNVNPNALLKVIEELDFETMPVHYFQLIAKDAGNNNSTANIVIEVIDMNDMPPFWTNIFVTKTFDEHSNQEYEISAKDGDLNIKAVINYKIECNNNIGQDKISVETIPRGIGDTETGIITINDIDRDGDPEINTITCLVTAYERDTPEMFVNQTILFMVQDINDNDPIITLKDEYKTLELKEGVYITIKNIFSVNDIDLGENAQYDVTFVDIDEDDEQFHEAFEIIPSSGYKNWDFTVATAQPEKLDYEDLPWQNFQLQIQSKDFGDPPRHNSVIINVELINLNDEIPIWDIDPYDYIREVEETVEEDFNIITVRATDRDIDDWVTYEVTLENGKFNAIEICNADGTTSANITTKFKNTFDYEKQTQVIIQVTAIDHLNEDKGEKNHRVSQEIIINVIDVNNKPPRISLPDDATEIEEHSDKGTLVAEIRAEDVDTTAELEFDIIWEKTYVMKMGRKNTTVALFKDIFEIQTTYQKNNNNEDMKGKAIGRLLVNDKDKLDYEEFETVYLNVIVTDLNQTVGIGTDTVMFAITIIDINDNYPIFTDSINAKRQIDEDAALQTTIGFIVATDADGPEFNQVKYYLKPINDTQDGLFTIGYESGELSVTGPIDADGNAKENIPPTYYLYYNVTATDGELETTKPIEIYVKDINNKKPTLEEPLKTNIEIKEGPVDECLQIIKGIDDDRDFPNNKVTYYLNLDKKPDLGKDYKVNEETGDFCVNTTLDRDENGEIYEIYLLLKDNNGNQENSHTVNDPDMLTFYLNVTDINNKKPELPELSIRNVTQNEEPGSIIVTEIQAIDRDKPCTDNTKITYSIVKVTDETGIPVDEEIFKIESKMKNNPKCEWYGVLSIKESLVNYYGKHIITLHTQDHGEGPQEDEKDYEINIMPFNFQLPTIIFPSAGARLILNKEQELNGRLGALGTDEKYLKDFSATDNQENKYSMSFELETETDTFNLVNLAGNQARLQLKKPQEENNYDLRIRASHNGVGNATSSVTSSFKIFFMDESEWPHFDDRTHTIKTFKENEIDICDDFPEAIDDKCSIEDINCGYTTYYHIIEGNDEKNFGISPLNVSVICVVKALDRENIEYHNLTIAATNTDSPPLTTPEEVNTLKLVIEVQDVNDNPPVFVQDIFAGSITDRDPPGKVILAILATDVDTVDEGQLVYSMLYDTIETSDASLNNVKDPFDLEGTNIVSKFQPQAEMKGYFSFKVQVVDSPPESHTATADVRIFIISDENRMIFTFENDWDTVNKKRAFIAQVFAEEFEYNCTIDDVTKTVDSNGQGLDDKTDVKAHFIDSSDFLPVSPDVIKVKLDSLQTISRLERKFKEENLIFNDLSDAKKDETTEDMIELFRILLIVISVVLGTLCIVLFIAFVLRTRSLQKRLDSMTTNVFGSTKSDLNRIVTNAPGTNRHAIEANPVWNRDGNEVQQFEDTISQASGGSDLIGVEDNPEFQYGYTNNEDNINPDIFGTNNSTQLILEDDDDDNVDLNNFKLGPNNNNMMF